MLLLEILVVIITILIVLIVWWCANYYKCYRHLKKIAAPNLIPLFGHVFEFRRTTDIIPALEYYRNLVGNNYWLTLGPRQAIIIADPKLAEFILGSNKFITKADQYTFMHSWLGNGLLTSTGEKWKKHRKMLTPAFHFKILEQFIEVFNNAVDILVDKLATKVNQESVDIYPFVTLCTLDIICESTMGTCVNAQRYPDSEYVKSVKDMCRIIIVRTSSALKNLDWIYRLSSDYQVEKRALKVLHGYTNSVINSRRLQLTTNQTSANVDEMGRKQRMAFLDLLLNSTVDGRPLTNLEIREEVDTFMFEGHDTTSSAISFTLFCLAKYHDVQEKVVQELCEIYGDDTRSATYSDLNDMKYLELVIKETLRLYPSVPFYGRLCLEDVQFDDMLLPKGLNLGIFAYGIGRNADIYPEPAKFDPERFSSENCVGRHPYSFVAFSAGPRNCIGQKFAMLEMKATISKILRKFQLLPTNPGHEPILAAETILKSVNGICIKLVNRSYE